jgi:hypothetical protein
LSGKLRELPSVLRTGNAARQHDTRLPNRYPGSRTRKLGPPEWGQFLSHDEHLVGPVFTGSLPARVKNSFLSLAIGLLHADFPIDVT